MGFSVDVNSDLDTPAAPKPPPHLSSQFPRRDFILCGSGVDQAFWSQPRGMTVRIIIERAALITEFSVEQLLGRRRQAPLCRARFAAMLVARRVTRKSYPVLARAFDRKDHTTIRHGCVMAMEMEREDPNFARIVREIAG